jgi:DNA-binding transcriptional LysR family regulator
MRSMAAGGSEYEQYSTLLAAAVAGLGLAVVPRFLAVEHLRAGTLAAPFGEVVRLQAGYTSPSPTRCGAAGRCGSSPTPGARGSAGGPRLRHA